MYADSCGPTTSVVHRRYSGPACPDAGVPVVHAVLLNENADVMVPPGGSLSKIAPPPGSVNLMFSGILSATTTFKALVRPLVFEYDRQNVTIPPATWIVALDVFRSWITGVATSTFAVAPYVMFCATGFDVVRYVPHARFVINTPSAVKAFAVAAASRASTPSPVRI